MSAQLLKRCLTCDSSLLSQFLDLHNQPLANSFHKPEEKLIEYPLAVNYCGSCFHVQLSHAVAPDELFKHYLYVSGTTKTLNDYFRNFVEKVEKIFGDKKLNVLDIACNDGSLLEIFKERGHKVLGVDPATNLVPLSQQRGVPVICDYWSGSFAETLDQKFDVIIAMNVFAHVSNPKDFLDGILKVLDKDGVAFIQTSQSEMIKNGEFDTIYHEHHSFFNTQSMQEICKRSSATLNKVEKVPIHGNSYLFYVKNNHSNIDNSVQQNIDSETKFGFYSPELYEKFAAGATELAATAKMIIKEYQNMGFTVCGYGAAAKANTFINFASLDLKFIVDDNPLKIGLTSPGMNIPVVSSHALQQETKPILCLILAWNFYSEIRERIKKERSNPQDKFFTYFPQINVGS